MADKNRTPDILGSVLSPPGSTESLIEPKTASKSQSSKQQGGKTANQNTDKTANQNTDKTVNQYQKTEDAELGKLPGDELDKVKATFYLSTSTVEALEDAWVILRRQSRGAGRKGAISKSAIVDMALKLAFEDLEKEGRESKIAGKLVDQ